MEYQQEGKPWYRRRWVIAIGAGVFLLVLLSLIPLGGDHNPVSMHAGSIKSNENLSTSSLTSGQDDALYSAQRILVLNRSDHPLMRGVADKLAGRLRLIPGVEQVDLIEPGNAPPPGSPLYDFYVVLELDAFDVSGVLVVGRTVKAKVKLSCGQQLFDSRHGYMDNYSPPFASLQMESTLEHESVAHGYETAGARYTQEIDAIEKQLGGAVEKNLTDWASKFVTVEELPSALLPAYRPVPKDLPVPVSETAELVLSGNGAMLHNYTIWTLETDEPFDVMRAWHQRLADHQWQLEPEKLSETDEPLHLRAQRGAQLVEAFELRDGYGDRPVDEPVRLVYRYSDRMTHEEVEPVLEAMLSEPDLPMAIGLGFYNTFSKEQRERLIAGWLTHDSLPFSAELKITRHLHSSGRFDDARARLRRLYLSSLFESGDKMKEVEKLGREVMEDNDWTPSPPTAEELSALGAQYCESNAEVDVALNESATFLVLPRGAPEPVALIHVVIRPSSIPEGLYTVETGMRPGPDFSTQGSSMSSTVHSHEHPWKGGAASGYNDVSWSIDAVETGSNQFLVTLEVR